MNEQLITQKTLNKSGANPKEVSYEPSLMPKLSLDIVIGQRLVLFPLCLISQAWHRDLLKAPGGSLIRSLKILAFLERGLILIRIYFWMVFGDTKRLGAEGRGWVTKAYFLLFFMLKGYQREIEKLNFPAWSGIKIHLIFTRRAVAERAENIGIWFKILEMLAQLAVISNVSDF